MRIASLLHAPNARVKVVVIKLVRENYWLQQWIAHLAVQSKSLVLAQGLIFSKWVHKAINIFFGSCFFLGVLDLHEDSSLSLMIRLVQLEGLSDLLPLPDSHVWVQIHIFA